MTKFYSRQGDFKKKDFVHPQIDLVCRMLGQIDDAGAAVQAEGLGYLYYSRGEAVLGAGKSSASFLESTSRVAELLMSASDVHAEVLQSIDSKLVKGLDEAFSSLNAVNSKAKPYKTAGKTYQTETYSYDMVNGYTIKKTPVTKHYTLDEILDRKNSPIPAVRDTYAQKAKTIRERLGKADDLTAEEIEKVKKMSDEELLNIYMPRLSSKDSYEHIKASTFHELNKGTLSGVERGANILAGLAMIAGVALAPFTGGASLYMTYTGGIYIAGSSAYSAFTGNTLISGTQLSTTERVFAGVEVVTTVLTLGGISVAKEGLSVSAKTAKVLTSLGNVADKVDDTMDVVQLAHGISEGNMESALADFALGKGMSIGVGGGINLVGNHLKKVRMKPEFDMDGGPSLGDLSDKRTPQTTYEIVDEKLKELGMSWNQFNELRNTRVSDMNAMDYVKMKYIREAIPNPTNTTIMQKVLSLENAEIYIDEQRYNTIGGYIAKRDDVSNLITIEDIVNGLRLDYDNANNVYVKVDELGKVIRDAHGNPEVVAEGFVRIEFKANPDYITIPISDQSGFDITKTPDGKDYLNPGAEYDSDPASGHGFIKSDKHLVPEYMQTEYLKIPEGSKMYMNIGGDEVLIGIADSDGFIQYHEGG